ncbi:MAG: HAD family phosphatase [Bacteriovoracaceae bacterium]|jgi:sugar-phosphatase|nr:HAD family phosphatase [Bacteriovoracaceae bacterium]
MITLDNFDQLNSIQLQDVKAVLFDMDGTVVQTENLHALAIHKRLKNSKYLTPSQIESQYSGQTDIFVYKSIKDKLVDKSYQDFAISKNKELSALLNQSIISSHIISFFKLLQQKKIKIALVTSSDKECMVMTLKAAKIDHYFDIMISVEDTKENKPKPMPYEYAMKKLNIANEHTIIFEDSPSGIEAACKSLVKEVYKVSWYLKKPQ